MIDETNILPIYIPVELCRFSVWQRSLVKKYNTNAVIRAIDTWLILKHLSKPSLLQDWNKQKECLLIVCKCSESVFRTRLRMLASMKLLTYDRHNIRLCSWEEMGKLLEIDTKQRQTIHYDITDKKRVQEWIIATEIADNQDRQAYSILQKLNKNPEVKTIIIHAMIAAGADAARIKDPGYLLNWLRILYMADFCRVSDIHDVLIELRPDTNRSVRGIASAWKAKHPTTISYWKNVLKKCGIIDVAKCSILSQDRARNQYCAVKWVKKDKQTLLPLCDQITVLTPWTSFEDVQKKQAA